MRIIWKKKLYEKIKTKKAIIGIIGLGYVGSALAYSIVKKRFRVIGFEKNEGKIKKINEEKNKNLTATTDITLLKTCDIIIICVQTPIHEDKTPDLRFLISAGEDVGRFLQKGQLITIESSINPGVTRHTVLPILKRPSLIPGEDFFLAFSPERINPGDKNFPLHKIPKVVSGFDTSSLHLITHFYENIFSSVISVSSLETAEMVKIFENTFRFVNISLVNELENYTKDIGIDMWEVIKAAMTKPFGFLAHFPGPGIGGHCIPVDPFYLYEDAKKRGITMTILQAAGEINDQQPYKVVESALHYLQLSKVKSFHTTISKTEKDMLSRIPVSLHMDASPIQSSFSTGIKGGVRSMHTNGNGIHKAKILLIGIAYKPDIDDMRESPAIKIWEILENLGYDVSYHDPFIPFVKNTQSVSLTKDIIDSKDLIIITTNHTGIDYAMLAAYGKPIVDTRHVYAYQLPNIHYI